VLSTLQGYKEFLMGDSESGDKVELLRKVVLSVKEFADKNLYKCERNVAESALSLLRYIVENSSQVP
jgi:hypothetical protein